MTDYAKYYRAREPWRKVEGIARLYLELHPDKDNPHNLKWLKARIMEVFKNREIDLETLTYSTEEILEHDVKMMIYYWDTSKGQFVDGITPACNTRRIVHDKRSKQKARAMVNSAIISGELKRPDDCDYCSTPCEPDAHHHNYSKPLDVTWLCKKCHTKLHKEFRKTAKLAANSTRA